jgi:NAD(P)-dependent dehydrogenase (short-subunit alcohol dehydrogenase family)
MTDPDGRVVLISGCSSGIGRALCEAFLGRGDRVVATARRAETVTELAGDRCLTLQLDVTDAGNISACVAGALEWGGRIDVLVNNAGYGLIGPVAELADEDLRRQLDTNVVGAVALIRAVFPSMAARRRGCIVNIGSVSARLATPFGGAYSASKAALQLLSEALRPEAASFGISVMLVQAGAVATNFANAAAEGIDRYRRPESLYHDRFAGIEDRAAMSKNLSMPVAEFASAVLRALDSPRPPAVLKIGGGARLVPVLALLPKKLLARVLARRFGLR